MSKPTTSGFFSKEASKSYDEKNQQLSPITANMHFLIRLVLRNHPARARVLCVGVGTGAEILSLSKAFPEWTFVGVDPSAAMLEVCRERLVEAGVMNRCELIEGYVDDVPMGEKFDGALSILVAHFVKREDKPGFFKSMCDRVRTDGFLINAEISFDLNSPEFPLMLKNWEGVQSMMGATPESIAKLPSMLREMLSVQPPEEIETMLRQSGISTPVRFFQALMICGWHGNKKFSSDQVPQLP